MGKKEAEHAAQPHTWIPLAIFSVSTKHAPYAWVGLGRPRGLALSGSARGEEAVDADLV